MKLFRTLLSADSPAIGPNMTQPRILTDFSLLRDNRDFRAVFVARTLSLFALGLLTVAVPVQALQLTGSPAAAGFVVAFGGVAAFVGLLAGGVLADRHDRRKLILFARGTCGLGFVALALNGLAASPSLAVVYALAAWDGFFSALGVTALLAATPAIVGRENLAAAGALNMIAMRLGGVASPALGGLLIIVGRRRLDLRLRRCRRAGDAGAADAPAVAAAQGRGAPRRRRARYCRACAISSKIASSAPWSQWGRWRASPAACACCFRRSRAPIGDGPADAGLMYSAVPLGATLGATTSGLVARLARPGLAAARLRRGAFAAMAALGAVGGLRPGAARPRRLWLSRLDRLAAAIHARAEAHAGPAARARQRTLDSAIHRRRRARRASARPARRDSPARAGGGRLRPRRSSLLPA